MAATRVLLVGEYFLGHKVHLDALRVAAGQRPDVSLDYIEITPDQRGRLGRTVTRRFGWPAYASSRALAAAYHRRADVVLAHTQSVGLLLGNLPARWPLVLSTDGTPAMMDAQATAYRYRRRGPATEQLQHAVNRRAFRRAATVIAWTRTTATSLTDHYGVGPEHVVIIPGGVPLPSTVPDRSCRSEVRLLFVSGDFDRKGGPELVAAFHRLSGPVSLDIVCPTAPEVSSARVRVHRDLGGGGQELDLRYAQSDVFVLPSRGDIAAIAIAEGMAAGLPVVSTEVGATRELVEPGETGFLVEPGDVAALTSALQRLVDDSDLRARMGAAGRARAEADLDADTNSQRVLEVCLAAARAG